MNYIHRFLIIFLAFSFVEISAQNTKQALIITSQTNNYSLASLKPINLEYLSLIEPAKMKLRKVAPSYYKQFLIRVLQTDSKLESLPAGFPFFNALFFRGKDHDGYDYFLPVDFDKKSSAEAFLSKYIHSKAPQAVVVKLLPNKVKCNCFGKF